jgi:RNA polymerase sigma factor (sigma-70 family)
MYAAPTGSAVPEPALLNAVLRGDEDAFRCLVEPHRTELHAHCYRMLGSVHDAEDVLQDVLLRAWRGLSRFEHGRPLRPWLYAIATNACLNTIARRPERQLFRTPEMFRYFGLPDEISPAGVDVPSTPTHRS